MSTMCSSALGPARLPSFVTWPTRKVGMFWPLAANSSCVAASRTWPMLPGADWNLQREDRLDRVDDDEARASAARSLRGCARDRFPRGCRAARCSTPEPLAARFDLVLGFLARAVEHRAERLREVRRRLQQQRRLADAWLAADEHERSGHDAAAEHAIELADAASSDARRRRCRCRRRAADRPSPRGCSAC